MNIPEPQPDSPTWPVVLAFAKLMEHKLSLNRHKGDRSGWLKCAWGDLRDHLSEEIGEFDIELVGRLSESTINGDVRILMEAADVANMAMMTADAATSGKLVSAKEISGTVGEMCG